MSLAMGKSTTELLFIGYMQLISRWIYVFLLSVSFTDRTSINITQEDALLIAVACHVICSNQSFSFLMIVTAHNNAITAGLCPNFVVRGRHRPCPWKSFVWMTFDYRSFITRELTNLAFLFLSPALNIEMTNLCYPACFFMKSK